MIVISEKFSKNFFSVYRVILKEGVMFLNKKPLFVGGVKVN
jgi:hypothetical protein